MTLNMRFSSFVVAALMSGISTASFWQVFVERSRPQNPILISYEISPRGATGHWLRMHWRTRAAAWCVRQGVQLLYRDFEGAPRQYFNIGASLNGGNLKGTVNEYISWYMLPAGLPGGEWQFIFRAFYSCPPFGLVLWETTTDPVPVVVPGQP